MRQFLTSFISVFVFVFSFLVVSSWYMTRSVGDAPSLSVFVVPQDIKGFETAASLKKQGFIRNELVYRVVSRIKGMNKIPVSGGYRLSSSMSMWQVLTKLTDHPDLVWVTIREGLRKEQTGESLAMRLGWTDKQLSEWNNVNADSLEYKEGVYFPETYLLPLDETPTQIAKRFIDKFNEKNWSIDSLNLLQRILSGLLELKLHHL